MRDSKTKTVMVIFILAVVVGGVFVFKNRYDIFRDWYRITINAKHNYCQKDEDCTFVRTRCDGGECFGEPVNKLYTGEYGKKLSLKCRNYGGFQVLMNCAAVELKCINGGCAAKRR
jgi:hypothetical protein